MDYRTALHNDIASNGLNNQMEVRYWAKILSASLLLILALGSGVQAQAATRITYIHNDHLGTPQGMTDESGTVVWKADYRPFGEADVTVSTLESNLRFPGQIYDQETGLHYNYFRDYDPGTGRYVESDPIGLAGGLNTYAYVESNPIDWIDEYGLIKNKNRGKRPVNPNKRPPPEHRVPGGQRERNVGHPEGEEHSRRPKGGFRPRAPEFIPILIFDIIQELCRSGAYSGIGCLPGNQPEDPYMDVLFPQPVGGDSAANICRK
ncbi:RHS repeat domain-containing protein [Sedimenticola sp.]|uniref:RHS repeat domain-containing protein n=1 Tax=Sedimenticola sp. TaxID=1940285 RepID=UPI003D146FD3